MNAIRVRDEIQSTFRESWHDLAGPGSWWTGAERMAIAEEVRRAVGCRYCAARKAALSPFSVDGMHDHDPDTMLPKPVVDAVHRVVTDAARLTRRWPEPLVATGLTDGHAVELAAVASTVVCIDSFHYALGLTPEPLPTPRPGDPSRYRPEGLIEDVAWFPMLDSATVEASEADIFAEGRIGNVVRSLSLVPDETRRLKRHSAILYLPSDRVPDVTYDAGRALSRAQIEFVAARVSILNGCDY